MDAPKGQEKAKNVFGYPLKVAICHEWLDNIGGGEKVLAEIALNFESPLIFTLWGNSKVGNELDINYQETFMRFIPKVLRRNLGFLIMPIAWISIGPKLRKFDLVITSSWAFAHICGKFNKKSINYIHTPGRYWWNPDIDQRSWIKLPKILLRVFRDLDFLFSLNHGQNVANSKTTALRISNFWKQESVVIHPPVDLSFFNYDKASESIPGNFLLGVGRFVPYKNMEFIIRLGEFMQIPVVLAGHGPLYSNLRQRALKASVKVDIVNNPTNSDIRDYYRSAKFLIFPVVEDFGIVPVEAMGCGLQVIGLEEGGLVETVKDGLSGGLVRKLSLEMFAEKMNSISSHSREEIRNTVIHLDKSEFNRKIITLIESKFDAFT
jgi:glycosyltransferase involved in cell wall biosynthesis